jgi:hypothetical protein
MAARLGRTFSDYGTLVETCRARANELGLSRMEIDRLAGFASGYSGKLLGKRSVEDVGHPLKKSSKKMWPTALEAMLGVLGLKIILIEDDAAAARTLALRIPVDHLQQRFGNISRLTKKRPPALPPPADRQALDSRAEAEANAA